MFLCFFSPIPLPFELGRKMALAREAKFAEVDPCKTLSFLQKIQALASKIYAIRTACVSCQFVYIIYNCNSQSLFRFFSGDVFFPATCKFHQCQRCKARVSLEKLNKILCSYTLSGYCRLCRTRIVVN